MDIDNQKIAMKTEINGDQELKQMENRNKKLILENKNISERIKTN